MRYVTQPPLRCLVYSAEKYYNEYHWNVAACIGKRPALPWKDFQTERISIHDLRRSFRQEGVTGLGVFCGKVSRGLAVRDFDVPEVYHAWRDRWPGLAYSCPTAKTGRGYHVFLHIRSPHKIIHVNGGELRGAGFCLLTPSWHCASQRAYEWVIPPQEDGDLPFAGDAFEIGFVFPDELPEKQPSQTKKRSRNDYSTAFPIPKTAGDISPYALQSIRVTLPTETKTRHNQLLKLARLLKFSGEYYSLPDLYTIIRYWTEQDHISNSRNLEENWYDFCNAYHNAATPVHGKDAPHRERLLALCYEFADEDGVFYLGVRAAGTLLNLHYTGIQRHLQILQRQGLLQRLRGGHTDKKAKRSNAAIYQLRNPVVYAAQAYT